uniref:Uncharacterized protein n=1 Tax=Glossina austeni TaxID=7395 RepID=A0A1A9VH50_GLOAU
MKSNAYYDWRQAGPNPINAKTEEVGREFALPNKNLMSLVKLLVIIKSGNLKALLTVQLVENKYYTELYMTRGKALRCFLKEFIARNKQHYLRTAFTAAVACIDCYSVEEEYVVTEFLKFRRFKNVVSYYLKSSDILLLIVLVIKC